jgi:hypothetical protein
MKGEKWEIIIILFVTMICANIGGQRVNAHIGKQKAV